MDNKSGTGQRFILSLFAPRFRKLADEAGKLYIEPRLSDAFVKDFHSEKKFDYAELENKYRELLSRTPDIQEF